MNETNLTTLKNFSYGVSNKIRRPTLLDSWKSSRLRRYKLQQIANITHNLSSHSDRIRLSWFRAG